MSSSEDNTAGDSDVKIWFRIGSGGPPPPTAVRPPRPVVAECPPPTLPPVIKRLPPPPPSRDVTRGVTVTFTVNNVVCAILAIFKHLAHAVAELAPYLVSFVVAFPVMGHTYNAIEDVIWRFFGRYFRI